MTLTSTVVRLTLTEAMLDGFAGSEASSEAHRITDAIAAALAATGGGMLDSHALADVLYGERCANEERSQIPSWSQTRDYAQYLLREAKHVCRHADGHFYRVHEAPVCSTDCDRRYGHLRPRAIDTGVCPEHFLRLPATGKCDYCED